MNENMPATAGSGAVVARDEFGARQIETVPETASTAVAARAKAEVEAAFIMAMKNPRDYMVVRQRMIADCRRPGFAKSAEYKLPRGGKTIVGPSIRFAESAERALGNLAIDVGVMYDDAAKRIVGVVVTDLERNIRESESFVIEKTMERKELREKDKPISQRVNSEGAVVYTLPIPDSELAIKQGAQRSKVKRNLVLAHLPGDIRDECLALCREVSLRDDAVDPGAAMRKVADAFQAIGITAADLGRYLGHSVASASPEEIADLRACYAAVKDGVTNWADLCAEGRISDTPETPEMKARRAALIADAAAIKASRPDAHEAAINALSLPPNGVVDTIPLGQLEQFVTIAKAKMSVSRT